MKKGKEKKKQEITASLSQRIEFSEVLMNEFTYRHSVYWKILFNTAYVVLGFYSIALLSSIPPYAKILLTVAGISLSMGVYKILQFEYERIKFIEQNINQIKEDIQSGSSNIRMSKKVRLGNFVRRFWVTFLIMLGLLEIIYTADRFGIY